MASFPYQSHLLAPIPHHPANTDDSTGSVTEGAPAAICKASRPEEGRRRKQQGKRSRAREEEEDPPSGYVHVRARRGQATDSHSLAERVRRERISERMRLLQGLVPGCAKVTGKALMLDEIINYVQSLQHQVEFLSMRIASLSPVVYDFAQDLGNNYSIEPQKMMDCVVATTMPPSEQQGACHFLQPSAASNYTAMAAISTAPFLLHGQLQEDNSSGCYTKQEQGLRFADCSFQ